MPGTRVFLAKFTKEGTSAGKPHNAGNCVRVQFTSPLFKILYLRGGSKISYYMLVICIMWRVARSYFSYRNYLMFMRKDIVIMCDQVTIEEINYNQNIMLDVNFISLAWNCLICDVRVDWIYGTRNKLGACTPGVVCSGFLRILAGRIGRILCSNFVVSPAVLPVVHSVYCACIIGLYVACRCRGWALTCKYSRLYSLFYPCVVASIVTLRSLAACLMAVLSFCRSLFGLCDSIAWYVAWYLHGVSVVCVCYVRRSTCIQFASGSRCM